MLRGTKQLDWLAVASIPLFFNFRLLPAIMIQRRPSLTSQSPPHTVFDSLILSWTARLSFSLRKDNWVTNFQFSRLSQNLNLYAISQCKDPRDQVYALLGISSDTENLAIAPDYTLDLTETFVYISKQIYRQGFGLGLLDLLSKDADRSSRGIENLPSWSYAGSTNADVSLLANSNAHPWDHCTYRFEENDRVMITKGQIIDVIVEIPLKPFERLCYPWSVEDGIQNYKMSFHIMDYLLKNVENNRSNLDKIARCLYGFVKHNIDAAWSLWCMFRYCANCLHSFTAGKILKDKVMCETVLMVIKGIYDILVQPTHGKAKNLAHGELPKKFTIRTIMRNTAPLKELNNGYKMSMRRQTCCRTLIISKNNRICNITGSTRVGDVVAILAGGLQVYVLRPVGEMYTYVRWARRMLMG